MKKTFRNVFTPKGITGICAACALVAGFTTNLTTIMSSAANACSAVGICSESAPKIAVRIANLDQNSMMHLLYGDNIEQDIASWASISKSGKRDLP